MKMFPDTFPSWKVKKEHPTVSLANSMFLLCRKDVSVLIHIFNKTHVYETFGQLMQHHVEDSGVDKFHSALRHL